MVWSRVGSFTTLSFPNFSREILRIVPESFEAKMKSFLRDSNERLHDLKRNTEGKRGGRGGRRD